MNTLKLFEICRPKQWKTISTKDFIEEGYSVYGANGIIGYYSEYTHEKPTIAITCRGATCGELHITKPFSYINGNAMALDNLDEKMFIRYLYYYLKNRGFVDVISGTAQPQITREGLKKVDVLIPPMETQIKIAEALDKAQELIDKRKEQIKKLDEFVQSVFLDMFGDMVKNPYGWDVKSIFQLTGEKTGAIKCGPFGSQLLISELTDAGIPVLGIENVQANKFIWLNSKFITEGKYEKLKGFMVKPGDVLISRTGTVGRTCVIPEEFDYGIIGPNLLKVSLNENLILPKVLAYAFNYSNALVNQIKILSPGATVPVFNTTNLKNVKIVVPPLELQNKFAQIVEKVEAQKELMEHSLTQMENNFNSIMDKAFRGELFN